MLNHPPPASSHCTSAPRLRPAPRSPRPCPAGHRRARKASVSVTDTRVHFVLMLPKFGTPLPVPAEQELRGSLAPQLGFRVSLRGKPKKAAMSNFQSWERSQGFLCHPLLLSRRAVSLQLQLPLPKKSQVPPTFLSGEEGSCALPSANLPLKDRMCSRRSDRPSPPFAEQHPSCSPALGFTPANGSFPKGRHEALFPPEPRPRGSEGCWGLLSKISVNCSQ